MRWSPGIASQRRKLLRDLLLPFSILLFLTGIGLFVIAAAIDTEAPTKHTRVKRSSQFYDECEDAKVIADSNVSSDQFPQDFFTLDQRRKGAVLFHLAGLVYMFVALAVVCDEFFVPSLSVLTDVLSISEDVAGATFMAAGGSAPEFFTSVFGVFVAQNNVGIGTIVGSATFNILCVLAFCTLFSREVLHLTWWPLFRDMFFYIFALLFLVLFFADETISWNEALTMLLIYVLYGIFMKYNAQLETGAKKLLGLIPSTVQPQAVSPRTEAKWNEGNHSGQRRSHPIIHGGGAQLRAGLAHMAIGSDDESGTDIDLQESCYGSDMESSPLPPRTIQVRPAGENGHLNTRNTIPTVSGEVDANHKKCIAPIEIRANGTSGNGITVNGYAPQENGKKNGTTVQITIPPLAIDTLSTSSNEEQPLDLSWPETTTKRFIFILLAPITFPLALTLPDVRKTSLRKWFVVTFLGSIIWIAFYSYLMVWWANTIGETFAIPTEIMGLTILAAGTSIPDLITSVIVARKGLGDMAVSSSIGSNLFDICIGLPVPWLLWFLGQLFRTHTGNFPTVSVVSNGLICSVGLLFLMLVLLVVCIAASRWKMDKFFGLAMIVSYVLFCVASIFLETGAITCPLKIAGAGCGTKRAEHSDPKDMTIVKSRAKQDKIIRHTVCDDNLPWILKRPGLSRRRYLEVDKTSRQTALGITVLRRSRGDALQTPTMNIDTRIKLFFIVFGTVYFLESIGGFYMTTAIVYIEKQFQIPSRLSGTMVSAGDFAYIPMVIFTSYFGGKGNRARWIGGGCILIAIANILISSSNFLFPVEEFHVNSSYIKNSLAYEVNSFVRNKNFSDEADAWLNETLYELREVEGFKEDSLFETEKDIRFIEYQAYCFSHNGSEMCANMEKKFAEKHETTPEDVSVVRVLTSLPYSFCHSIVNKLRRDHKIDECAKEKAGNGPFYMIFGGLLVLGVGRTMPFSLGLPLMDDNVKKANLPVYFAFMFFVRILGPVIGLLVGSKLNTVYVNFNPPQGLTVVDPMWIGCWWLGFLIFGIVLFFPSVILALFPTDDLDGDDEEEAVALNGKDEKGQLLKIQNNSNDFREEPAPKPKKRLHLRDKHIENDEHKDFWEKLTEFGGIVKTLFKNKIFVGCMLGRIVDVLAFKGFFVFLGKYLELEFGVPQYRIQKYLAGTGVVGFAIGVMSGSLAMKKLKLQGRKAAAWVAMASLLAAITTFVNGSVGCKSVIGNIGDQARENNFTFASCRPDCLCDDAPLYPVCNEKGDVFYSPCHAGCPLAGANFTIYQDQKEAKQTNLVFTECECAGTEDLKVSRSYCEVGHCEKQFKIFFAVQAIGAMVGGMAVVPGMMIILRAVKPEHRSISLGFNGFLVSLFATLPSPIFWGKIFDSSCLMWQTVCGQRGACPIYDTDDLRIKLFMIYGSMRVFSLLSDIWTWVWAKDLKLTEEEDVVPGEAKKEPEGKIML